ncbi:flagellar basal body rod protein FlgF [Moritella viscosa]
MDNMLYISMSGAKENMNALAVRANNIANVNTHGFKADFEQARSMQAFGEGLPTRVFAITESPGQDFTGGGLQQTGNALDVAIQGDGWLSVLDDKNQESYTRGGSLHMSPTGELLTSSGRPVLGENGPIVIPVPVEQIKIHGNVSAVGELTGMINLQRQFEMQIKMMKTAEENDKASDSLLRVS